MKKRVLRGPFLFYLYNGVIRMRKKKIDEYKIERASITVEEKERLRQLKNEARSIKKEIESLPEEERP